MFFLFFFALINNPVKALFQIERLAKTDTNDTVNAFDEIQDIIMAAEKFENSITDLEYTVLHLKDSTAKLQNKGNCPFDFFTTTKKDDTISIIEVMSNSKNGLSIKEHMQDIVTCLQEYLTEEKPHGYFTENINMRVYTITNEDLYRYEVVTSSTIAYKSFRDFLQSKFIYYINHEMRFCLQNFLPDFLIGLITQYINDNCIPSFSKIDYKNIRNAVLESFENGKFYNLACNYINALILGDKHVYNRSSVIDKIVSEILKWDLNMGILYFAGQNITLEVRKIYLNELQELMRHILKAAIDRVSDRLKNSTFFDFTGVCNKYIAISRETNGFTNSLPFLDADTDIEHILDTIGNTESLQNCSEKIGPKIEILFGDVLRQLRDAAKSRSLYGIKPKEYNQYLKVVCSEKITNENLHLLCHILNNIPVTLNVDVEQILYINMRQNVDIRTISRQIKRFFEDRSCTETKFSLNRDDNMMKKINVIAKSNGSRNLSLATFDVFSIYNIANKMDFTKDEEIAGVIQNILSQNQNAIDIGKFKQLALKLKSKNNMITSFTVEYENFGSGSNEKARISILIDVMNDRIKINNYTTSHNNGCRSFISFVSASLFGINRSSSTNIFISKESETIAFKYIRPKLLQFFARLSLMPEIMEREIFFDFGKSQRYQVNDYILHDIVAAKIPRIQVLSTINDITGKIERFYRSNSNTAKICKLETNLFDFLSRNQSDSWKEATQKFLSSTRINQQDLESAIQKHFIERYLRNATNDYAIPSIMSRGHKILIIAVVRKNKNTILYLVRKDLEPVMSNLPLTNLLNFYVGESNDTADYDDDSYLNHLPFTNSLDINTIAYVVQTMAVLRFNMAGDFVNQFKSRKYEFINRFHIFIDPLSKDCLPIDSSFTPGSIFDIENTRLSHLCYRATLEKEVLIILQHLEQQKNSIKYLPSIRVTACSLKAPDTSDIADVDSSIDMIRKI